MCVTCSPTNEQINRGLLKFNEINLRTGRRVGIPSGFMILWVWWWIDPVDFKSWSSHAHIHINSQRVPTRPGETSMCEFFCSFANQIHDPAGKENQIGQRVAGPGNKPHRFRLATKRCVEGSWRLQLGAWNVNQKTRQIHQAGGNIGARNTLVCTNACSPSSG